MVWSPKNCDREDGMEHARSCPMLQMGVKGENGNENWNEYHFRLGEHNIFVMVHIKLTFKEILNGYRICIIT